MNEQLLNELAKHLTPEELDYVKHCVSQSDSKDVAEVVSYLISQALEGVS